MPSTACGKGMVKFVIKMKSAGSSAGGTDITRAPIRLSPEGPGTKFNPQPMSGGTDTP